MTTQEIRSRIHVVNFYNDSEIVVIKYLFDGQLVTYRIDYKSAQEILTSMGCIEEYELFTDFSICQWDAFALAVRHQQDLQIENDDAIMRMDEVIKKLNQNY